MDFDGGELGGITVEPNPAQDGGKVTIRGKPNQEVYILVPGDKEARAVKLDKDGKSTLKVPVAGGKSFTVSDLNLPRADEVLVRVVSSLGGVPHATR
ncbi:MAG: hypothetical protein KDC87_18565 [Planctomycetes bacterium]|nr:hypothetical protein [Planctomycetota bacterium]MCB9869851.1 hypothetical protein [Planctomycetota bacterium]